MQRGLVLEGCGRISHNRSHMRAAYSLGRTLALSQLPRIKAFLADPPHSLSHAAPLCSMHGTRWRDAS